MKFDIIGDIHGYADQLVHLLEKLIIMIMAHTAIPMPRERRYLSGILLIADRK